MHTCEVRRTGSVPQEEALAVRKVVVAGLHPRVGLLLPRSTLNADSHVPPAQHIPLDAERVQHLHLVVPVGRPVGLPCVGLERAELLAAPRDRVHLREVEREKVLVQWVERAAVCVPGHGGRDELRGDFLCGTYM